MPDFTPISDDIKRPEPWPDFECDKGTLHARMLAAYTAAFLLIDMVDIATLLANIREMFCAAGIDQKEVDRLRERVEMANGYDKRDAIEHLYLHTYPRDSVRIRWDMSCQVLQHDGPVLIGSNQADEDEQRHQATFHQSLQALEGDEPDEPEDL